ncbi:cytochrome P450 family protein [Streptomyces beihaiensis]|uniref:Cytochrome P450 n=1 Tax=Streptomyces beihaiensis TaxID=2984495 RepID=A0ABT3U7B1_9ACTN|nr:cytochrome P450 [Streptomyces beihaiensis]MCX3064075.1 cytochrome P450 [Streptomyces beihaiensis]
MHQQSDTAGEPAGCPAHGNIQLYGPEFGSDPERHYARLRAQGPSAPVDIAPDVQVELVTSYDAALHILHNPASFVRDARRWNALNEGRVPADSPALPMMGYRPNALFSDGAAHARLRQAVTDSLATVDQVRLVRLTQQSADYLISRFSSEPLGQAELMSAYAQPLPLLVFSDLFGCPPELGDRVIVGISGIFEGASGADEVLGGALAELIALKRRQPGEDLTTRLMVHSARLTDEEVLHQLVTLLSGGTAPLTAAIGTSSALYLGEDWPTGLPIEDAVVQTLWNYAPIANYAGHYPTQDIQLGDRTLRAGDPVLISFAAANTDPKLSEHREQLSAKAHLAFGAGPHACPAKDPAFMIAATAVESLLNRLPDTELRVPFKELAWAPTPWSRTLVTVPVRFTPRAVPQAAARNAAPRSGQAERPSTAAAPQSPSAPRPAHHAAAQHKGGLFSRFRAWVRGE